MFFLDYGGSIDTQLQTAVFLEKVVGKGGVQETIDIEVLFD